MFQIGIEANTEQRVVLSPRGFQLLAKCSSGLVHGVDYK